MCLTERSFVDDSRQFIAKSVLYNFYTEYLSIQTSARGMTRKATKQGFFHVTATQDDRDKTVIGTTHYFKMQDFCFIYLYKLQEKGYN